MYGWQISRALWSYMGIARICWIINENIHLCKLQRIPSPPFGLVASSSETQGFNREGTGRKMGATKRGKGGGRVGGGEGKARREESQGFPFPFSLPCSLFPLLFLIFLAPVFLPVPLPFEARGFRGCCRVGLKLWPDNVEIAVNHDEAPSTRVPFCLKTQLFLWGLTFVRHVSDGNANFPKSPSRVEIFLKRRFRVLCGRWEPERLLKR